MEYKMKYPSPGHISRFAQGTETIHLLLNIEMKVWICENVFTFTCFFFFFFSKRKTEKLERNTEQKLISSTDVRNGDL